MADLDVGRTAPSFELPDQQDHPWSLSGQLEVCPAVLVFYRGDWCPYCNGQLASYARKYGEFEGRGAQLAGISVDPPRNNAGMVGKLQIPYPLLSDRQGGGRPRIRPLEREGERGHPRRRGRGPLR
jgi:peroxiredoxin